MSNPQGSMKSVTMGFALKSTPQISSEVVYDTNTLYIQSLYVFFYVLCWDSLEIFVSNQSWPFVFNFGF